MQIHGTFDPAFAPVADELKRQLRRFGGGAAASVWLEGEPVVDIWAGNAWQDDQPWTRSTIALSFSATKGVTSTLFHILAAQGHFDYEAPVARYWPEFGQNGKQRITIRHLLAHEAGLFQMRGLTTSIEDVLDWNGMIRRLEQAEAVHAPGVANGYHAFTIGWLLGHLIELATGQSFSEALQTHLNGPLGLEHLHIGISDEETFDLLADIEGLPPLHEGEHPRWIHRYRIPRGIPFPIDRIIAAGQTPRAVLTEITHRRFYEVPIPSANGTFTARDLAKMYAMLACDGELRGTRLLPRGHVAFISERQARRLDRRVLYPLHWRLGYHRADSVWKNYPEAFGHYGFGGAGGWANPKYRLSAALVHNGYPMSLRG
ncbi:MAG: class A beta-lactamase-related serine hydrolase, partial [Candidatus Dadabacteria bacterium]